MGVIGAVAAVALGLGALVSRIIKRRGSEALTEAGTGDSPGSADRGPDGQRM